MAEKINDIVKNLLDGMHAVAHADTIVGEPAQVGEATVIPVHRVRIGFMAGAIGAGGRASIGEGKTGSRAVGGTAQIDPVAVLAVGPDGRPRLLAVEGEPEGVWQGLLRDTPDLMARLLKKLASRVMDAATVASEAKIPAASSPAELPAKKSP